MLPCLDTSAYLCSALRHFDFELVFGCVRESHLLGKEVHMDDAVYKESTAHHGMPFIYLFLSSTKLQGTAEEDTCASPLQTAILIYRVSVQGQRRGRLLLSSLRDSGSSGSR